MLSNRAVPASPSAMFRIADGDLGRGIRAIRRARGRSHGQEQVSRLQVGPYRQMLKLGTATRKTSEPFFIAR